MVFGTDGNGRLVVRFKNGSVAILSGVEQVAVVDPPEWLQERLMTHAVGVTTASGELAIRPLTSEEAVAIRDKALALGLG